ncbi:MAG: radical SAM family heme chaperone HemW [bacterium]
MLKQIGLYLHFPFCIRRCPYCAFYSNPCESTEVFESFVELLLGEFYFQLPQWRDARLLSIYFGGGTPSLLAPKAIERLCDAAKSEFSIDADLEVTLECNPGTVDVSKLEDFAAAGVNRLSIGVQALNDDRLEFLGRIHRRNEAIQTVKIAKNLKELSVSVDLMIGAPLETRAGWDQEVDELLELNPDAISFYSLTIEEGTDFARRFDNGEEVYLPAEETVELLLHVGERFRQAGFRHYEVSNWAKTGMECRHNLHYWRRGLYLGLGPSAHSFDGTRRSWNAPNLAGYSASLQKRTLPPCESEHLNPEAVRTEWVFLKLRQDSGLDFKEYQDLFGAVPQYWGIMFNRIAERGMGSFDGICFRPNDRGLLLADEIAARILG